MDFKKVLVLAPHADDSEVSCGGTISRFSREGKEIYIAVFSETYDGIEKGRIGEFFNAVSVLGVPKKNLFIYNFKDRRLNENRQDILEILREIGKQVNPDLVLMPSLEDIHQDHQVISNEGLRAFQKEANIFGYEYPWNHLVFHTTCFVKLEEEDLEKKIKAMAEYKSQQDRTYFNPEVIRGWALTRGVAVKTRYAESFEVIKLIFR